MTPINELTQAYSVQNLTQLAAQLIKAYKNKNHSLIYAIANTCHFSEEASAQRLFGKIIQLYHPDKSESTIKELKKLQELEFFNELESYTHIFKTEYLLKKGVANPSTEVAFENEEVWEDSGNDDFEYFSDDDDRNDGDLFFSDDLDFESEETAIKDSYNFYEAIQLREYGDLNKSFPTYYLEDLDAFELASSQIDSLDGIQYCKHAKIVDLSDNDISDLSEMWELSNIEELYLAYNQLSYIDTLSNLTQLKILDLSFNQVDDISALLALDHLEYVNLVGNPLSQTEIELLKFKGVQVIY